MARIESTPSIVSTPHTAASTSTPAPTPPVAIRRRRWLRIAGLTVVGVPTVAFGLSLLLTPPLEPPDPSEYKPLPPPEVSKKDAAIAKLAAIEWPEGRLDGEAAKVLLLDLMLAAEERLEAVEGYTATLRRRERIRGKLGAEQTIQIKIRHRPFGVYMYFVHPDAGKEAVYSEGRYDNHIMAHGGGISRALVPRLKVPPDSPIAMAGNRHPITDAGLLSLTKKLVYFREMDMEDDDAGTILDTVTDQQGRTWLRSIHTHTNYDPRRPFMYVEVLYDPETKLPYQIDSYEWPRPGKPDEKLLGESYRYDDLVLDAPLTDLDFDPANPAYAFHRF